MLWIKFVIPVLFSYSSLTFCNNNFNSKLIKDLFDVFVFSQNNIFVIFHTIKHYFQTHVILSLKFNFVYYLYNEFLSLSLFSWSKKRLQSVLENHQDITCIILLSSIEWAMFDLWDSWLVCQQNNAFFKQWPLWIVYQTQLVYSFQTFKCWS